MTATLRILVADDDEGLRQLMRLILRHEGFEVIEAVNGQDALARAQDSNPSVVLLDIMMPGMDGLAVCRNLKNDQRFNRVPVIFVTAIDDLQHRVASKELGIDDYIKKPIGPRELVARVRGVMERRGIRTLDA
jgi:two-component system, OmpR family, alkaline phosphatase synthesis response regulator PhoP